MAEELLIYFLMIVIAGVLSLLLCFFSYVKLKNAPGARPYIMATLFSSIFTFSYALELASNTLQEIKFWLGIEYLVMPFIPSFLLLMCCEYIGIKLSKRFLFTLFVIPIFTVFMHHTNELHHLYYSSIELRDGTPFPIVDLQYGPFFYVHSLYLFLCLSISIVILLVKFTKSLFRFRMQILTMVAGLFVPIVANHFYVNNLSPYGIDLGPVSMSISFLLHGLALFSFQMFQVIPIAREKVFENMLEGVIVVDQNGLVVDYNKAILSVIPKLHSLAIGKPLQTILVDNKQLADLILLGKECDYECGRDTEKVYYQVRFSPVTKKSGPIVGKIITFVNITERVVLQKKLRQLANYDGLTQIYNRTYFMDKSVNLLKSLDSNESSFSIIMFDIDYFKRVNDTYGHEAGDNVLTFVANLVKSFLRENDIFARYGGEEFIILLPETNRNLATEIATKIGKIVSDCFIDINGDAVHVTLSIGVASATPGQGEHTSSLKSVIKEADHALYAVKRNGRNNVQLFEEEMEII
ncbi:histidine kinase N-terminal 7TM domain-containing protein [Ferdinandcohnia sp. Marseille-Q9671]